MTRHKHADLIIAWAKGAKIQFLQALPNDIWQEVDNPRWMESTQYRIKPEPPKPLIRYSQAKHGESITGHSPVSAWMYLKESHHNIKATFDPAYPHNLLSIEMI
jgi:hypothetical protein